MDRSSTTAATAPSLVTDERGPALVHRFHTMRRVVSTAMVNGGLRFVDGVFNAQVPSNWWPTDPVGEVQERMSVHGLDPTTTVGLATAALVGEVAAAEVAGVRVDATVGIGHPLSAGDATGPAATDAAGTINLVVQLPITPTDAAMVNLATTVTEAKAAALWAAGLDATGTSTDAVVVVAAGAECIDDADPSSAHGGPVSPLGWAAAAATRRALAAGLARDLGRRDSVVLVTGGAGSGKSDVAEHWTRRIAGEGPVTYIATGEQPDIAVDPDWAARVQRHRDRRPPEWTTVEVEPDQLADVLRRTEGVVLVESTGTWVARQRHPVDAIAEVVTALIERSGPTIVVGEEVGGGVHPATEAGRRFREDLGAVNRAVAAVASRCALVVAGRVTMLRDPGVEGP